MTTNHEIELALLHKKDTELTKIKTLQCHNSELFISIIISTANYSDGIARFIKDSNKYYDNYIKIYLLKYDEIIEYVPLFLLKPDIDIGVIFINESCKYSLSKNIAYYEQYLNANDIRLYA